MTDTAEGDINDLRREHTIINTTGRSADVSKFTTIT